MGQDTQVLIVGAGPTGLMLACELVRYQVAFRIIDKKQGLSQDEALYLLQNPIAKELRNHVLMRLMGLEFFQERQNKTMAQMDVNYRKSSIVDQNLGSLFHLKKGHLSDHAPFRK